MRFLLYMLRIRRVEFRIAEIPILAIPVFLTVRDASVLKTLNFWEGIIVFFFLFAFGDMINCLADRDLDAVYKPHLSEAVYGLGVRFVTFQVAASGVMALVLAAHLSWRLDRWMLLILVAVGLALGAAYSVKPVQLKGRGVSQLICLWLIIFVGPMLLVGFLVGAMPSISVAVFAAAFGTLQMGIILINTAEDYPEDLNAGIKTTIVALGLHRGIALAFWLTIIGTVGVIGMLVILFIERNASFPVMMTLLPVAAASIFAAFGIYTLKRTMTETSLDDGIQMVKLSAKNVPLWVTLVAWSALGATGTLFYVSRVIH